MLENVKKFQIKYDFQYVFDDKQIEIIHTLI